MEKLMRVKSDTNLPPRPPLNRPLLYWEWERKVRQIRKEVPNED